MDRYPDDYFHLIVEKACLDSLFSSLNSYQEVLRMNQEVCRVLLCRNQPLVWVVLTKLENSLARSNRSRFG